MSQPIVKSRRQHIRLWFGFYKLALESSNLQCEMVASFARIIVRCGRYLSEIIF